MPIEIVKIVVSAILMFSLLLLLVFATGNTFGQRCSALGYPTGSEEWKNCIQELKTGSKK